MALIGLRLILILGALFLANVSLAANRFDFNKNGLSDSVDMSLGWSPVAQGNQDWEITDSDNDGFTDKEEIEAGFDPLSKSTERLQKRLMVTLSTQTLSRQLGYLELDNFKISAGTKAWPTPVGDFRVRNKDAMAWSPTNKLYLPYWLGFATSPRQPSASVGFHALALKSNKIPLPGAKPMGQPDSHGCVRVPEDKAPVLFAWADVGATVSIRK